MHHSPRLRCRCFLESLTSNNFKTRRYTTHLPHPLGGGGGGGYRFSWSNESGADCDIRLWSPIELLMAHSDYSLTSAMNHSSGSTSLYFPKSKMPLAMQTESNENCQMDRKESELAYSVAEESDGIFGGMA